MKNIIFTLILLCAVINKGITQSHRNEAQIKIAEQFISLLKNQNYEGCWNLFDQDLNKELGKERFLFSAKLMYESLPDKNGELEIYMNGVKFVNGMQMNFYSFKYLNYLVKPVPSYIMDIIFSSDKSVLIAGVQPKKTMNNGNGSAATSKGKETIITASDKWKINSKEYNIKGINIVHFNEKSGAIAVQVEQKITDTDTVKQWAYSEGIKFAKFLFNGKAYKIAMDKAKELNLELMPEIGVSFIDPETGRGYNTLIKPDDFK